MTSTAATGQASRPGATDAPGRIGRIGAWCYDHRRAVLLGWIIGVIAIIAVPAGVAWRSGFLVCGAAGHGASERS